MLWINLQHSLISHFNKEQKFSLGPLASISIQLQEKYTVSFSLE